MRRDDFKSWIPEFLPDDLPDQTAREALLAESVDRAHELFERLLGAIEHREDIWSDEGLQARHLVALARRARAESREHWDELAERAVALCRTLTLSSLLRPDVSSRLPEDLLETEDPEDDDPDDPRDPESPDLS